MHDQLIAQDQTDAQAQRAPIAALAAVVASTYSLVLALVLAQAL
jgi:hypothetical protein